MIKTKEITYYGYRQGFKVYIDGVKYPREYGHWFTDMKEKNAIERAKKEREAGK